MTNFVFDIPYLKKMGKMQRQQKYRRLFDSCLRWYCIRIEKDNSWQGIQGEFSAIAWWKADQTRAMTILTPYSLHKHYLCSGINPCIILA